MLPYFGSIDIANLKEHYHTNIVFPDHDYIIGLNLNFENKQRDQGEADNIAKFLSDLEELDNQNHLAIEKDFVDQSGATYDYFQVILEDLQEMELAKIIGKNNDNTPVEECLLNKQRLVSPQLYPEDKYGSGFFSHFDYSIDLDGKPCDYFIVI